VQAKLDWLQEQSSLNPADKPPRCLWWRTRPQAVAVSRGVAFGTPAAPTPPSCGGRSTAAATRGAAGRSATISPASRAPWPCRPQWLFTLMTVGS
jgi:hypothetical protein